VALTAVLPKIIATRNKALNTSFSFADRVFEETLRVKITNAASSKGWSTNLANAALFKNNCSENN
jgi:hypothetical protein